MKEKSRYKVNESIVHQFTMGDMRAFDNIYSVFNPKLQKFVFTLVKTEADTEEIVQEVFVKIWENRENLKNYASFESYLFTIAYNCTVSLLRERTKETRYIEYIKSIQIEIGETDTTIDFNQDEICEKLNLLIEEMPSRQREVFKMKHFQNLSYREIAEHLKISVNTVENHMVKAHKYLKDKLGKSYFVILLFMTLFY